MQPKGYMPYYEEPHVLAEIDVRGRFISMSCDIEWSMLNIMAYCSPDPFNQVRNFKGMMMNQKIECTIADLKNNKPDYYNEYKEHLDQLIEFKTIRNDLSHYRLDFHKKPDLTSFRVFLIDEHENIERVHYKEYTIQYLNDAVKRFRKANLKLAELVDKLYRDYKAND